jgi:hypothetical protein
VIVSRGRLLSRDSSLTGESPLPARLTHDAAKKLALRRTSVRRNNNATALAATQRKLALSAWPAHTDNVTQSRTFEGYSGPAVQRSVKF